MARPKDKKKIIAIYNATLHMVLRYGIGGLKMSEVARDAGLATGTVYVYFRNKSELVNQLYRYVKQRAIAALLEGYSKEDHFDAGFRKMFINYLEYKLALPEEGAFVHQYYRSPFLQEEIIEETEKMLAPLFELFDRGKKEKRIINLPTEMLVAQLVGSLNELAKGHTAGLFKLDANKKKQVLAMAWNSVKRID